MKYLLIGNIKEPIEKNMEKMNEIEKGRIERGENFAAGSNMIFPIHVLISSAPPKQVMVVDTTEAELAKWIAAYSSVMECKISPLMTRQEWQEATN